MRTDETRRVAVALARRAAVASTGPAGESSTSVGPPGQIRSRSIAMVVTAMTPWPHIVLQPSLCMNSTPACAPGVTGSVSSAPYMSAWPRGSSMSERRR